MDNKELKNQLIMLNLDLNKLAQLVLVNSENHGWWKDGGTMMNLKIVCFIFILKLQKLIIV